MQSSLEHLPPHKQREIERVVEIIFEEFEDALALATQDWKRKGRISKIILYGSYARGGWVDEPHTAKGYQSDYDLLIIVNDKRLRQQRVRQVETRYFFPRNRSNLAFPSAVSTATLALLHSSPRLSPAVQLWTTSRASSRLASKY